VKVINFEEEALLAIQKEVEILRTVRSESVVGFIGSYLKGSRLFVSKTFLFCALKETNLSQIAMEFCDGGSVKDILRKADRVCSEDEISAICAQVRRLLNRYFLISLC